MVLVAVVAVVVVVVVVAGGCGAGSGGDDATGADSGGVGLGADLSADLTGDLSEEQRACVIDRLTERFGPERVDAELAASTPDPDFAEARFTDMFRCGVRGDVRGQILEELMAGGVAAGDALCVADELVATLSDADVDVLLSGEITSAFAQKFDAAMDACGAAAS